MLIYVYDIQNKASDMLQLFYLLTSFKINWLKFQQDVVTQNAVRPGVRPYVPPKMAEGDFWLIIYHCTTIYNKNSNNVRV